MADLEGNGKALPKKGRQNSNLDYVPDMGSNPSASKIFNPNSQNPVFKKDLYADLEKIEERGKRKKGFSIFGRNKK